MTHAKALRREDDKNLASSLAASRLRVRSPSHPNRSASQLLTATIHHLLQQA